MFSSEDYGSPVFWTSLERPEPRLLNPSGAFNDPFYPQIRVKNQKKVADGQQGLEFADG
jgi:hypothetical protein